MRTSRAVLCYSLAFAALAYLDTATTLAAFDRGSALELNPTLAPTLSGHTFRSLIARDVVLGAACAIMLAWSWGKRHRFALVDGELTFRKYYKNYERIRNAPLMVVLLLPLTAAGLKLLAVINNALIVSGIGSPYSGILRTSIGLLPLSVRQIHVVFMGFLGCLLCLAYILCFYQEAASRARASSVGS